MTSSIPHSSGGILPYSQHTKADTASKFSEYALKTSKNPTYKEKIIGNKTTGAGVLTSLIDNSNKTYYTTGPFSKGYVSAFVYDNPLINFDISDATGVAQSKDIYIASSTTGGQNYGGQGVYQIINLLDGVGQKGSLTFNTLTIFVNNSYLQDNGALITPDYDEDIVGITARIFKVTDYQDIFGNSGSSSPISAPVRINVNGQGFYDIKFSEDITITPFDENDDPVYYYLGIQISAIPTADRKSELVFLRSVQGDGTTPIPDYTYNTFYTEQNLLMTKIPGGSTRIIPGTLYFTLSKK